MPAKDEAFFEKEGKKQAGLVLLQRKIKKKKEISGCCCLIEKKVKLATQKALDFSSQNLHWRERMAYDEVGGAG